MSKTDDRIVLKEGDILYASGKAFRVTKFESNAYPDGTFPFGEWPRYTIEAERVEDK